MLSAAGEGPSGRGPGPAPAPAARQAALPMRLVWLSRGARRSGPEARLGLAGPRPVVSVVVPAWGQRQTR